MTMVADARPPVRPRSCANADGTPKRIYHSRAAARAVARRTHHGVHEYACPTCPYWHVGNPGRAPR